MFSRILHRTSTTLNRVAFPMFRRGFADSKKDGKMNSTVKAVLLVAVSVPVGSVLYMYATNRHFREVSDRKVLCYVPFILKYTTKWFPMDYSSPYQSIRVMAPIELKKKLAEVFTDLDFVQDKGFYRQDAVDFVKMVVPKVPEECISRLESGEYLYVCIEDHAFPNRVALKGLNRIMSIDEFIAFVADATQGQFDSPETFASMIDSAKEQYEQSHGLKSMKERGLDSAADADFVSLGVRAFLTSDFIIKKYSIDEEKLDEYMRELEKKEEEKKRKTELQREIDVVQYDISLINDEIKEKKANGATQEELNELYQELQELKARIKKLKRDI